MSIPEYRLPQNSFSWESYDDPGSAHWYWGVGAGAPGAIITYFEREPRVRMGAGQTHHYAFAVPNEDPNKVYWPPSRSRSQ